MEVSLISLGVLGAALYIGGSLRNSPKLALVGIILLDIEFAVVAALLLYARSYVLGGAFGFGTLYVLGGLLQPGSKK